jgi:sugar O-acyltransferase (sialic acid O-acetyltransferase NeuD family)
MKKAVIFGTAEFAQVASVYLRDDGGFEVCAFTVNREYIEEPSLVGLPVVPFEELPERYPPSEFVVFLGVGYSKINANRRAVYEACRGLGYKLPSYVHSNVLRWKETSIGEACFIFENNVIQPFVTIGNNCVLWSGNHIGHHTTIGDNVFIASHAVVSGNCRIGSNCFVGVNATFRDGITVGENSVIGAGVTLLKDADASSLYKAVATPPQERRSHELRSI